MVAEAGSVGQSKAGKTKAVVGGGFAYVRRTECMQLARVAEVALYEAHNLVADLTRYREDGEMLSAAEVHAKVDEAGRCASEGVTYLGVLCSLVEGVEAADEDQAPDTGNGLYL